MVVTVELQVKRGEEDRREPVEEEVEQISEVGGVRVKRNKKRVVPLAHHKGLPRRILVDGQQNLCVEHAQQSLDKPEHEQEALEREWAIQKVEGQVVEALKMYADSGDLQTGAMIALVFYDLLYRNKAQKLLVRIIISYIELLRSMQLFSEATHVIKTSSAVKEVAI